MYSRVYIYRGDRLTSMAYRGQVCMAVLKPDGKCVRGKNGNMLVRFVGSEELTVVVARQLRRLK